MACKSHQNCQQEGDYIIMHKYLTQTKRAGLTASTALTFALCGGAAAYAQMAQQASVVNPDQPIEVAATLTDQPLYQTGPSTTVITAKQIAEHNYQTMAQILRTVPGVELYQTGGPGGATEVYLRGGQPNMTKVIVDGINISDPSVGSVVDFSQIPVQNIQSIQVVRGPQSGLYGADAAGGVIVITTKQPKAFAPPHLALNLGGGNFGSTSQSGTFTDYYRGLHTSLSYDHLQSSGVMVTPLSLLSPGQTRTPDYSDRKGFTANLAYDVTPDFTIGSITHYIITTLKNTATPGDEWRSTSFDREWFLRDYATLHSFDDRLTQTVAFVYTYYSRRYLDPNYLPPTPYLYSGKRTGLDYNGSFNLTHDEVLVFGAQWQRDSMTSNGSPASAHVENTAGFAELNSNLPYNIYNSFSLRVDANSQFGKHVTFREAPVYIFKPTHTRFHASIGTGFDAPTLADLYGQYIDPSYTAYNWYANPNLKPETSLGWDLGVDQPITSASSVVPITVGVTYFHNKFSNLIYANDAGNMYTNIGKATTDGVESYVKIQPLPTLFIKASYTYLHAEDDITHQELQRRAKNSYSLTADWAPVKKLTLASSVTYKGDWYDVAPAGGGNYLMPHYTLVNLSATYQLSPKLALYVRGTNLLNRHYQDPNGFMGPTLGVFGGIKINTDL